MTSSIPLSEGGGTGPVPTSDRTLYSGQFSTARIKAWYWLMCAAPFVLAFIVPFSLAQSHPDNMSITRETALALRRTVTITGWLFVGVVVVGAIGGGLLFARARAAGDRTANTWLPASLVLAMLAVVLGLISTALTSVWIWAPSTGGGVIWGP